MASTNNAPLKKMTLKEHLLNGYLTWKKSRDRLGQRLLGGINKILKRPSIENLKDLVQKRDSWYGIVVMVKNIKNYLRQRRKRTNRMIFLN